MKAIFADCFERTGNEMHVRGRPIERLVDQLRGHLNRIVIDETGIPGNLDIDLKWEFATGAQRSARMLVALEEQVGLKVVERRAPVPVVIIERIQRPTPN